ncbi:hypothetical protein GCM10010206_49740 [Streptomyces cinerochromogenes]|nr:hypothetical protein GCM10010206_49740 [Streptomyces cinerochromogenes]
MREGIATLRAPVHDTSLIRVAERLVSGVEGGVGVASRFTGAGSVSAPTRRVAPPVFVVAARGSRRRSPGLRHRSPR